MKPPYTENGMRYCIMPDGSRQCTGAQMGRGNVIPPNHETIGRMHLRRVPFRDGCYDPGGAYWGLPANLFCAWGGGAVVYVRAKDRRQAKAFVRQSIPTARFLH